MLPALLAAGWAPTEIAGFVVKEYFAAEAAAEWETNGNHYIDCLNFNFNNGFKSNKTYTRMDFADLPPKEKKKCYRIYDNTYPNRSYREIAIALNLPLTSISLNSPVESKLTYEYYRLYGTWEYHSYNVVTERDILTRLRRNDSSPDDEYREYRRMFNN
jgi:hypothetical protein